MRVLQIAALVELALCWVAFSLAFVKPREQAAGKKKVARAPASKWGIFLVMVSFALAWAYVRPVGFEKSRLSLVASMLLGPPSAALAWAATRHLGATSMALRSSAQLEDLRTDPNRPVSRCWGFLASYLCRDVGNAAEHRLRLDLVAHVGCGGGRFPGWNRNTHSRGRPPARRTLPGVLRSLPLTRARLHPADSLTASGSASPLPDGRGSVQAADTTEPRASASGQTLHATSAIDTNSLRPQRFIRVDGAGPPRRNVAGHNGGGG